MKKSLLVTCLLSFLIAGPAVAQVNNDLRGLNGMRCQTILQQERYFVPFMALANGYVSAKNDIKVLGGAVYKDMMLSVIDYCVKKPMASPWDVIESYKPAKKQ